MLRWICFISMTACASVPRPTSIPLTIRASRAVTMPVVVDGTPFVFQLDTGASNSVITPATRDRLHLAHGKAVATSGAGGAVDSAEAVVLHDMHVGDRQISNLEVAVVDLGGATGESSIDGILGQDVLARFIAEIDLGAGSLVLHPRDSTAWRTGELAAVPFTLDEGLIRVEAKLDGVTLPAILDLGATATIASPKAAPAGTAASGSAIGADGRPSAIAMLAPAHLELGSVDLGDGSVVVSDLPVFGELHLADQPALILGIDRLDDARIVIDPGARLVYISRRNPAGSPSVSPPSR